MMDEKKRDALAKAGFVADDHKGMLDLSPADEAIFRFRMAIKRAVRGLREEREISQAQFAKAMGSTQPKVALIETTTIGASTDHMLRALFALGGTLADLKMETQAEVSAEASRAKSGRRGRKTQTNAAK